MPVAEKTLLASQDDSGVSVRTSDPAESDKMLSSSEGSEGSETSDSLKKEDVTVEMFDGISGE